MALIETIIEKIKKVIFNPNEFFESVKAEAGIIEAFKFFVIVSLVYLVFTIILFFATPSMLLSGLLSFGPFSGLLGGLSIPIFIYIFSIVLIFVVAAIAHIVAMLLGGKGDYSATYKALAYAATPYLLVGWIPFLGIFVNLYSLFLAIIGISKLHQVTLARAFAIVIIPVIILIVLIAAFSWIFTSMFIEFKPTGSLPSELSKLKLIQIVSSSCLSDGKGIIVIKNIGFSTINLNEISVVKDNVSLTYGQFTIDNTKIAPGAPATIKVPCTTPGNKQVCQYLINGIFTEVACGY
jgi:hypothetical protein